MNKTIFQASGKVDVKASVMQEAVIWKDIDRHPFARLDGLVEAPIVSNVSGLRRAREPISLHPTLQSVDGLADVHYRVIYDESI